MKIVIEVTEGYYSYLKEKADNHKANVSDITILDGKPYKERPTGHWIEEPSKLPHCSECGTYSDDADREDGGFYCTHCGAKMEVEND